MASSATRLRINVQKSYLSRCDSGKLAYPTREHALDVAEALMSEGRVKPGCHITPYQCDDCGWWHVANRRIVFVDDPAKHRAS